MAKTKTLTAKQRAFVLEYVIDWNATGAAVRAGYSARTANQIGPENLVKPCIQAAIAKVQAKSQDKTEHTLQDVMEELGRIGFESKSEGIKVKALELLGKHLGAFPNKLIVDGNVNLTPQMPGPVLHEIPDDQLDIAISKRQAIQKALPPPPPDPVE